MSRLELNKLINTIRSVLTDELRRAPWKGSSNKLAGHCYIFCEVLYHLNKKKLKPYHLTHEGSSHWFLKDTHGFVIDPTVSQFSTKPDYANGIGKGFLTKSPSKRAQILITRIRDVKNFR